jgi:hydroxymethylpyrimidine kinase/phosphomethylpyrimidine kinase
MSVITAVTSQNTLKVSMYQSMPAELVEQQIEDVVSDIGVDIIKTGLHARYFCISKHYLMSVGMLANADIVKVVADAVKRCNVPCVVDPVMVSTAGGSLFDSSATQVLLEDLIPRATILTPNLNEAATLLVAMNKELKLRGPQDMLHMAKTLHSLGSRYVLLKGGHAIFDKNGVITDEPKGGDVVDVLVGPDIVRFFTRPHIITKNLHGTGCSLASAIACFMLYGNSVPMAVDKAINYVNGAIMTGLDLGKGQGPVNHMFSMYRLPFVS